MFYFVLHQWSSADMAAYHEKTTSYTGITKQNTNPINKNTTLNTNHTSYTSQTTNTQFLGQPTGNNFEEVEIDRERTVSLETREGKINTEKLHAYFQL